MAKISLVDSPLSCLLGEDGTNYDSLEMESYASALAKFSMECDTPLTIGVQGEWGSGKTSILNMMLSIIENSKVPQIGRGGPLNGSEVFKSIWINTWEHSLLKSPEECLLSIVDEIINEIAITDGSWNTAQKAKSALGLLAKSALTVGASLALGEGAANIVGGSLGASSNSVKQLRQLLEKSVDTIVDRNQTPVKRFLIFIDDLDRLDPTIAVMILELLKNIFNINHCVFILAIDYQVVVKGLKSKFGELTEHNEWEFRAFFDKIIQLPFMMPVGAYNLSNYFEGLLKQTSFFKNEEMRILKTNKLTNIINYTVGTNPRSLKRLVNSLSLILIQQQFAKNNNELKANEFITKQLLVTLVCIQISYPKIYNLLLKDPIFYNWDDDTVKNAVDKIEIGNFELEKALQKAMEVYEEDFDEEWEQTLFKISWANNWHKNKVVEISRALTIIKDKVLLMIPDELEKEKMLKNAIKLTSVTSISLNNNNLNDDKDDEDLIDVISFWKDFKNQLSASEINCAFKNINIKPLNSKHYQYTPIELSNSWGVAFEVYYKSRELLLPQQTKLILSASIFHTLMLKKISNFLSISL